MKFFVGQDERPVQHRELGRPSEHFTWCLDCLHTELLSSQSLKKQINSLDSFKNNMLRTEATCLMFLDIEPTLNQFKQSLKKLDINEILEKFTSVCIPDEGYICSYG